MLTLLIHGLGRSLHLLINFSISFSQPLKFLSYKSFTCLVRSYPVNPRYFILFVTIVKDVLSLISFAGICHLYIELLIYLFILSSYHAESIYQLYESPGEFWGHLCILFYYLQIVRLSFFISNISP